MEYTKRKWKAHFEYLGGYDSMSHSYEIDAGEQHIASLDLYNYECADEDAETEEEVNAPEAKANAHLIVAAVEACKKLNPDNPMAVAEGITGTHEALKYARAELLEFIEDNYKGTSLLAIHMEQLKPIDKAIAKVEVK